MRRNKEPRHLQQTTCLNHPLLLILNRCNCVQWRSQYVPLNKTCKKKFFGWHLLKTTSFLESQITQHIADMPLNKCNFSLWPPCFNQWLNKSSTSFGGAKPKIKWIALTAIEKRYWILSSWFQKLQTLLPIQFRLAKLSFVSNTPLFKCTA